MFGAMAMAMLIITPVRWGREQGSSLTATADSF